MILALADDLTGALEIGAKFAQYGLPGIVLTEPEFRNEPECSVLVIDTETRHAGAAEAAKRTRDLVSAALKLSPDIVYKKTDSTLRGNIAAELEALLEAAGASGLVYAPAYPEMGRTVRGGELYVWGTPVHLTEFAQDRLNPVVDCRVEKILGDLPVTVLDGESKEDVRSAAEKILKEPAPRLCAGPAALAEEIAHRLRPRERLPINVPRGVRCLVVNGSLHPASIRQMEVASENGLFDGTWTRLNDEFEATGMERAMLTGESVRRRLASEGFDVLIVFGGDTAFGIHRSLGAHPFRPMGEIAPGVPVSRAAGLLWITKAGGFGMPDILVKIRKELS